MITGDNKWRAGLIVLGIFALGIAVGALSMDIYRATVQSGRPFDTGPRPSNSRTRYLERLTQELGLTEEQSRQVSQILEETRTEFIQLRNEMRPRFDEIRRRSNERLRAVFTPEQQAKFEQMMKRLEEERSKFHGERERR